MSPLPRADLDLAGKGPAANIGSSKGRRLTDWDTPRRGESLNEFGATLPQFGPERRLVVCLSDAELNAAYLSTESKAVLLSKEICVLRTPLSSGDLPPPFDMLQGRNMLRPGVVLIQNPFDWNDYFDFLEFSEQ